MTRQLRRLQAGQPQQLHYRKITINQPHSVLGIQRPQRQPILQHHPPSSRQLNRAVPFELR